MVRQWSLAFTAAALIALVGTELARRLALAVGFVDRPGPHKSHAREVPYLGGVAIAGAALIGWQFEPRLGTRVAVTALAAAGVALVGLVDDDRGMGPRSRLVAEVAAAVAVVAAGMRVELFGFAALDIAVTIAWIVGVTNALNLLDNMDGLAGGVACTAGAGVFVLAALGGQPALATAAAALVGACAGFLAHNVRPASIFMGDAGALFLGFVLSVAVLEVRPGIAPPASVAVPAIMLALPVLDTSVVTLARLRRGRAVTTGGKDHLSHRLVALGAAPGLAVAALVAVEAIMAALAVLVGRGVLPTVAGVALGAVVLVALGVVTTRASVYDEPVVGLRTRLRKGKLVGTRRTAPSPDTA